MRVIKSQVTQITQVMQIMQVMRVIKLEVMQVMQIMQVCALGGGAVQNAKISGKPSQWPIHSSTHPLIQAVGWTLEYNLRAV